MHRPRRIWLGALVVALAFALPAAAINIQFDYTYDTSGYFTAHPQAKTMLDTAALTFDRFYDKLSAIAPSGSDTWRAKFYDPTTGATRSIRNLQVPADTLILYIGAQDLAGGAIAESSPGWYTASGSSSFNNTVANRGRSANVFSPWGGWISFDNTFNYDYTLDMPTSSQVDFYSVAMHEMCHVLGFGSSTNFTGQVVSGQFTGPKAEALYGGPVPVTSDSGHWADLNIASSVYGVGSQEVAMDTAIGYGQRKIPTDLDLAALADIGWSFGRNGDANLDGVVDGRDYTIYADNAAAAAPTWSQGDFNCDGKIDSSDYAIWAGAYAPAGGGSAVAAPEPCSLALLAVGGLASIRRRAK